MKKNTFRVGQVWESTVTRLTIRVTAIDPRGRVEYEWVTYTNGQPCDPVNPHRGIASQVRALEFFNLLNLVPSKGE